MTGYGLDADRERSFRAGFDLHLVKPCDVATVLRATDPAASSASDGGEANAEAVQVLASPRCSAGSGTSAHMSACLCRHGLVGIGLGGVDMLASTPRNIPQLCAFQQLPSLRDGRRPRATA
jgi:hypothetical protein